MSSIDAGFTHAPSKPAYGYTAEIATIWPTPDWSGSAPTPFQRSEWLDAFYAAAANDKTLTPLIATLRNAEGEVALRLPLIKRKKEGVSVIEFADLGMTDFNAPLLGPAAPQSAREMRLAWRALRRALPKADLLSFQKLPPVLNGKPNPLSLLAGACPSPANGNPLPIGDDWDAFRFSWEKTFRKELERSWRVFQRHPEAQFHVAQTAEDALKILQSMETQQRERMQDVGSDYKLDQPLETEFYRRLVEDNVGSGYAILTALMAGDEVVAALLGVRDKDTYIMIRICHAGGAWSNCSPGRLIIERTMAHLHSEGCRVFDFSVGNYSYKRRFGVTRVPLLDFTSALSWRGIPETARARLAAVTRQYPQLHARIRKALGRSVSREET